LIELFAQASALGRGGAGAQNVQQLFVMGTPRGQSFLAPARSDPTEYPHDMCSVARESVLWAGHLGATTADLRRESRRICADLQRLLAQRRILGDPVDSADSLAECDRVGSSNE
jgi:hypothetical protein